MNFKLVCLFLLGLFLVENSFAGFMPKAFEGNFIQVKKTLRGTRKAPVNIKYSYPKNIRMEVTEGASKVLYICNPEKTWIYNEGNPPQVREGQSAKYCYSQIFDALNKGLKDNNIYTVKKEEEQKYLLNFSSQAATRLGYDQVRLYFSKGNQSFDNIAKIDLIKLGKRAPVTLEKQNLKVLSSINKSQFILKIPKNAEVQKMK